MSYAVRYILQKYGTAEKSNYWRTDQRGNPQAESGRQIRDPKIFDEEAAIDLLLRLGLPEIPDVGLSPVIKYRLLVGGVGIAYEGESESEGRRQFGM